MGPKLSREEDEVVERDEMRAVSSTGVQQPGGEVKRYSMAADQERAVVEWEGRRRVGGGVEVAGDKEW